MIGSFEMLPDLPMNDLMDMCGTYAVASSNAGLGLPKLDPVSDITDISLCENVASDSCSSRVPVLGYFGQVEVLPRFALQNKVNASGRHAKFACEFGGDTPADSDLFIDPSDLFVGERRFMVFGTTQRPPSADHIAGVLLDSSEPKMAGPYASGSVAGVQNQATDGLNAVVHGPAEPVRSPLPLPEGEDPIVVFVNASSPEPTRSFFGLIWMSRAALVDSCPKTRDISFIHGTRSPVGHDLGRLHGAGSIHNDVSTVGGQPESIH